MRQSSVCKFHWITAFDTVDVDANGKAEEILGEAPRRQRRDSIELFPNHYWPIGPDPKGQNNTGLSHKRIMDWVKSSCRRLGTNYVDLYQAQRDDLFTLLKEIMQAFADVVRSGKALYFDVSEWPAQDIRDANGIADEVGIQLVSRQPEYSML